jgi:hypothetical protein
MTRDTYSLKFCLVLWVLLAGQAYGDGAFVWKRGADLNEPSQKAIIYWHDGEEVLILQVKYEGLAEDFAWIVPLPAKPKVDAIEADKSPFAEISLYTQQRLKWGKRGDMDKARPTSGEPVTVLERKVVGVYDVAVLAASDAGALSDWLNKNGYAFPEKRTDVLEHYTAKKWMYVAMRVDRKALAGDEVEKLKVGELQPIRFAFDSDEMIYPLRISSINAGYTELLLYCLAEVPMVVRNAWFWEISMEANLPDFGTCRDARYGDLESGTYRKARGDELPLTWATLGAAKNVELSLCKYRYTCRSERMVDDLTFQPFEAQEYWRQQLARADRDRFQALNVLASFDPELIERLAVSPDRNSRIIAAGHPKTPERLLLALAKDGDSILRWQVAKNPNASGAVLRELARDDGSGIRCAVAVHPETPVQLLDSLAVDSSAQVRCGVASHPRVTIELLRKLAEDENSSVRARVALRKESPIDVLKRLADDADPEVARSARQTIQQRTDAKKNLED